MLKLWLPHCKNPSSFGVACGLTKVDGDSLERCNKRVCVMELRPATALASFPGWFGGRLGTKLYIIIFGRSSLPEGKSWGSVFSVAVKCKRYIKGLSAER